MIRQWIGVAQRKFTQYSVIGKILRIPLNALPSGMSLPIISGKLRGKKWIIGSGIHRYWLGTYELEKQEKFSQMISPGNVVYDIGANVGFYSLLASLLVGQNGRVVAFEPVLNNLEYLGQHLVLNHIENVDVWDSAVSDDDGVTLFDFGQNASTGHLSETGSIQVRTISIDKQIANKRLPIPQVIKIDIEGAEIQALHGARKTIAEFHPIIFLATHGPEVHSMSCELLTSWGYTLHPLDNRNLFQASEILAIY